MRAAHYLAVQVRADMCNFPDVYEWRPTAHQRLMGSRWLPDTGSNGWRGACSDSTAFFEMVRRRDDQQLHLHTWTLTERERERGGHVSGSKCSRSFKSSALSDFAKDEFAVFTTTSGSVYSPSEPLWLLTSRRVTITLLSGVWKARFLPSVF